MFLLASCLEELQKGGNHYKAKHKEALVITRKCKEHYYIELQ